ncbi:MAG: hypothetical protein GQ575_01990 [Deltaproteobacteria bacterium]|nr:hypothetical protein [Deltaproteobacteria bacterium]
MDISDFSNGKNKKNFELLIEEEFIARVTQHIPEKGFQMMRSFRWHQTDPWGSGGRRRC